MRKLARAEVADIRAVLLAKQGFACAVCGTKLRGNARGGATLDHCHDTGVIRGVLCRSCNGGEGKVKNAAIRYGGGKMKWRKWLQDMLGYLAFHSQPRTRYLHPTWLNEDEKRLKRNKKARLTRARRVRR
jgi:hypothetical protein